MQITVWGYMNAGGEASECLSVWIEMDMSERVHFKVLYFYILQHFTLTGGLGQLRGCQG